MNITVLRTASWVCSRLKSHEQLIFNNESSAFIRKVGWIGIWSLLIDYVYLLLILGFCLLLFHFFGFLCFFLWIISLGIVKVFVKITSEAFIGLSRISWKKTQICNLDWFLREVKQQKSGKCEIKYKKCMKWWNSLQNYGNLNFPTIFDISGYSIWVYHTFCHFRIFNLNFTHSTALFDISGFSIWISQAGKFNFPNPVVNITISYILCALKI